MKSQNKGQDKGMTKGKKGAGVPPARNKGESSLPYVGEDREQSQYTSYTSREHQWGPLKKPEACGE